MGVHGWQQSHSENRNHFLGFFSPCYYYYISCALWGNQTPNPKPPPPSQKKERKKKSSLLAAGRIRRNHPKCPRLPSRRIQNLYACRPIRIIVRNTDFLLGAIGEDIFCHLFLEEESPKMATLTNKVGR